jgi:formylglycine-generating enzyme required for sulfatase activity
MKRTLILLLLIPACSGDDGPRTDGSIPDAATDGTTRDSQHADTALVDQTPQDGPTADRGLDLPLQPGDGPATDLQLQPGDGPAPDLAPPTPDLPLTPDAAVLPSCHPAVTKQCTAGWCTIPAGCFNMGSPATELCRAQSGYGAETLHQVTFTHTFEISQTEVTQQEYQAVMATNPSGFPSCGATCPVEGVSWHQAAEYCNKLSQAKTLTQCYTCSSGLCAEASAYAGKIYDCPGYRLPTEAEWEYAYRAGTTTAFYTGPFAGDCTADANADKAGWTDMNSNAVTHPVSQKLPNAWGLYDMSGNVWEWVNDSYQQDLGATAITDPDVVNTTIDKVLRGGCYDTDAGTNRAAGLRRGRDGETEDPQYVGFRVARSL